LATRLKYTGYFPDPFGFQGMIGDDDDEDDSEGDEMNLQREMQDWRTR
jgi:hypothetical protein